MRPTRVLASAAGTAALVVALITAAAASASAPTHAPGAHATSAEVEEYVALGDSYTAGPLIPDPALGFGCFRSTRNYPARLAAALEVDRFVDASCSGADTTDLTSPQRTGLGTMPPQLSALSADTDLVTLGIGGNDFGVFRRLVSTCPAVRSQDPDEAPCRDHFRTAAGDTLLRSVARTGDRLVEAVGEITRRAPEARVVLVGYPRIAPAHGTCPAVLPFADGDYRYANRVERRLNAALRHAATVHDAAYVDTYGASRGHDACAGEDAWVNGARTDLRRAQNYHPFGRYMGAVADLVVAEVARPGAS